MPVIHWELSKQNIKKLKSVQGILITNERTVKFTYEYQFTCMVENRTILPWKVNVNFLPFVSVKRFEGTDFEKNINGRSLGWGPSRHGRMISRSSHIIPYDCQSKSLKLWIPPKGLFSHTTWVNKSLCPSLTYARQFMHSNRQVI